MASSGNFGQSVTVSAGFGSLTTVATPSVAFLSEVWFSSGTLAQFDSVRDPTVASDDYMVRVTTNNTSAVARIIIYSYSENLSMDKYYEVLCTVTMMNTLLKKKKARFGKVNNAGLGTGAGTTAGMVVGGIIGGVPNIQPVVLVLYLVQC